MPIHHKGRDRRDLERIRFTTFRLKAFVLVEGFDDEPIDGFSFVSEISAAGAGLYVNQKIAPGTPVRVAFEARDAVTYRATVMWSHRFSLKQNFFGHDALAYRVGLRYIFRSEAERQRYLKYFEETKRRVLAIEPGLQF